MVATVGHSPEPTLSRWVTVLWGIGSLIVGLLLVVQPAITALFLVQVMALLWLIGGVVDLVGAALGRGDAYRGWRILSGIVAIFAGVVLLGNPFVGTLLVVLFQFYLIAIAAIINGVVNIVGRFQGVSGWGRFVLGIVQLAVGVFFLFNPIPGLLAFIPVFGIVLAVGGLITIVTALFLRAPADATAQPE
jgi:uncharacterized membrane protein HdeD (DUF308 family)